ncbi:hypothetical protein POM88_002855 [Heracleum sosnowskyi]|uniref:Late embryogenesis abundant protein LEA-2 subgroup domain-containing protein n=1 Tax=Heracleum sosnowskyi TaxID=360622 RepID=A0AAD8JET2_9APIA|nr:hypothetical protein POM88_002855 [Heracleum sosnowskyi]
MYRTRETNPHFLSLQPLNQPQPPESATNPHFLPSQPPQHQPQPPWSQPNPSLELPAQPQARPLPDPSIELATQPQPRLQRQSKRRGRHGAGLLSDPTQSQPSAGHMLDPTHSQFGAGHMSEPKQSLLGPDNNSPTHSQPRHLRQPRDPELLVAASPKQSHQLPMHPDHPAAQQSSVQRIPPLRETKPFAWCVAIFCAIFWILIILTGLIVLLVYLVNHPKSPKFDVAGASLNAAYLDMNYLVNADLMILVNFTNPNRKVNVNFKHVVIKLYFDGVPIATEYIDHFHLGKAQYLLANVHMLTSQVRLSQVHSQNLGKQIESGRVSFEVKSFFRAKSKLGNVLKYSDSFVGHCSIVMTPPPAGVLVAKTCGTKS